MDLEARGGTVLAEKLVDRYDEYSGEHHPRSLLMFYVAQRAQLVAEARHRPTASTSTSP